MNILLARGNPRKDGYTQRITDLLAQGARDAGAVVTDVDLMTKKISECIGCYTCFTATPGRCIFNDDMAELLELILQYDILLCSTPLYHYLMSSSCKRFLERTLSLTMQGFEKTPRGLMRNRPRYPERWKSKKLGFISAGAFRSQENFDALRAAFRLLADGFSSELCAEIVRPEAYLLQFDLAKPKTVRSIETALKRAGAELAIDGRVSEKTHREIALPLAVDMPHFLKYSEIYWEHAVRMGGDARDLAKVQKEVLGDMRILMSEMARSIDPVASAKLKAVLQFDFPDKDLHFRLAVDRGTCTMEEVASEKCDLRVVVETAIWSKVFTRQINVREALMKKHIVLEGDKMLFTRLDRYFPPPVS